MVQCSLVNFPNFFFQHFFSRSTSLNPIYANYVKRFFLPRYLFWEITYKRSCLNFGLKGKKSFLESCETLFLSSFRSKSFLPSLTRPNYSQTKSNFKICLFLSLLCLLRNYFIISK